MFFPSSANKVALNGVCLVIIVQKFAKAWKTVFQLSCSLQHLCNDQGCGVGAKISDSRLQLSKISDFDFPKFPNPTFPKFPTP